MIVVCDLFFFSSRRRHTRCALVTEFRRVLFRSLPCSPLRGAPGRFPGALSIRGRWTAFRVVPLSGQPQEIISEGRRSANRPDEAGGTARQAATRSSPTPGSGVQGGSGPVGDGCARPASPRDRSEEHTSELQSHMRISYAVLCLNKKTKPVITRQHEHLPQ